MNVLTGKCKKDFDAWLFENCKTGMDYKYFSNVSFSMQYGVLVDFFQYKNIWIELLFDYPKWGFQIFCSPNNENNPKESIGSYDLSEARTEAIKKANEIYNSI